MAEALPKGLTRGYANQFLDALNRVHEHKARILTTREPNTQATLTEETETA